MKIEVTNQETGVIEFIIEGERHTLPNLLKKKLLEDSEVEFCAYKLDHPLDEKAKFVVRGKNPKKSLEKAVNAAKADVEEFRKAFEKAK